MLDCTLIENDTNEDVLKISNIPESHQQYIVDLVDDCGCRIDYEHFPPHVFAYGSPQAIKLLRLEVIGIVARMQHLDACLLKSDQEES